MEDRSQKREAWAPVGGVGRRSRADIGLRGAREGQEDHAEGEVLSAGREGRGRRGEGQD